MATEETAAPGERGTRLYLPVALLVLSLFVMVGLHTIQLIGERSNLSILKAGQEATVQESQKLRQQLESIAGGTALLANDGDPGARAIIEDLRRQGIAVAPPARK